MILEKGKFYVDKHGKKVGPLTGSSFKYIVGRSGGEDPEWDNNGYVVIRGEEGYGDLVSEWTDDGPVRTVTRREIVLGDYGRVRVNGSHNSAKEVSVIVEGWMKADELRSAAMIFSQLAEALDENADNA